MKKILTILAIMMVAMCPGSLWADENIQWTEVSTDSAFYAAIRKNHSANIRLTADIDLKNHKSSGDCIFEFEFKGKINGVYTKDGKEAYHVLENSQNDILFEELTGAEIYGITISNCSFEAWDTHSGWLAASAKNSTFDHVFLSQVSGIADNVAYDGDCVGGLIGEADDCQFYDITAVNVNIDIDGYMAGCIVGKATGGCTFRNILVNMLCSVWADGNTEYSNYKDASYAGGVCGYCKNGTFRNCINYGLISAYDDRLGGIVGFGYHTFIYDCNNCGTVISLNHDGFKEAKKSIKNYASTQAKAENSNIYTATLVSSAILITFMPFGVLGPIGVVGLMLISPLAIIYTIQDPDEVGGIAGHLQEGSSIVGCSNYGYIHGADAHVGGIVGYLKESTVTDCCNRNLVCGAEQTGGIVGMNDEGTIKSCLNLGSLDNPEDGVSGHDIQGDTSGNVTLRGNCYTSVEENTDTIQRGVSQLSLATGSVAAYLNKWSRQTEKRWTQHIGTDLYPSPTAFYKDTTAIADENVVASANYVHKASNVSELQMACSNPAAIVELTGDIDMKKTSVKSLCGMSPFRGALHGNGHTLKNDSIWAQERSDYDNENDNVALFQVASHATFDNLIIDNFRILQDNDALFVDSKHTEAFLVGSSHNCSYKNITVKNSSIEANNKTYLAEVGSILAISSSDTITDCSVDQKSKLFGYSGWKNTDTNVGGIASKAYGSIFKRCFNAAKIWADDNQEGGIAAYAENCVIDSCLNTGGITAQENVGGICGNAVNTSITNCVNTGWIDDDDNTREDKRSGIVGVLNGSKAIVSNSMNFGSVNYADENCGPINDKRINGATYGTGNLYYCQFNGKHIDNTEDNTKATYAPYAKMLSGEYTYNKSGYYQNIDGSTTFPTNLPVPIPAAGKVYVNILCDGATSYSNIYRSTAAHTGTADENGKCTTCGNFIGIADSNVYIKSPEELVAFAKNVNSGVDFSKSIVTLDTTLDMSGQMFQPIGTKAHPFKGVFNGNGHRISNLTITGSSEGVGLFGRAAGSNTIIKNVTLDNSCAVSASVNGVGGIIGCVESNQGDACKVTIQNCGNEADVRGNANAGGIIGGVYSNTSAQLVIQNCYNAGDITGTSKSATICGFAKHNYNITNCYNTGKVLGGGNTSDGVFYTHDSEGVHFVANCYDINGKYGDGVKAITSTDVALGTLCNNLNSNREEMSAWTQNLGTDSIPSFGDAGIHHSRTMTNQWGTLCLPYDIDTSTGSAQAVDSNTDYELYELISVNDGELTLQKITASPLKAGTPVIIRRDAAVSSVDIKPASTPNFTTNIGTGSSANGLTLTGTYTSTEITNKDGYIIANNAFWNITDIKGENKVYCVPFRAYLAGTLASGAKQLTIGFNAGDATAVEALNAITTGTAEYYDLNGHRINDLQLGVNIIKLSNGTTKKVIIR